MSQQLEGLKYICYCSKTVKLDQRSFNAHMEACSFYQRNSKFYQLFQENYIQRAKISNLLGVKTGLEILVDEMNKVLDNKNMTPEFFSQNYEEKYLLKEAFHCLCDKSIEPSQQKMKEHLKDCQTFQEYFPFNQKLMIIKENIDFYPFSNLVALKCEFLYIIEKLSQLTILKSAPKKAAVGLSSGIIGYAKKCGLFCLQKNDNYQGIIVHDLCGKAACKTCFRQCIEKDMQQDIQNIKCPFCQQTFSENFLKKVLLADEFQSLLEKQQEALIESFGIVKCIKCNWSGQVEENAVDQNLRHPRTKQILSPELIEHYKQNRFLCECSVEQCKKCRVTPYHLGYTCEQFKNRKENNGCRFCGDELNENEINFCNKQECLEKTEHACQKKLACGHFCGGVKNEKQCLPCLHRKCYKNQGINGNESCILCIDALNSSPVVFLQSCGHTFHYTCIVSQINMKWQGRIVFNFCLCQLCQKWMVLDQCPELQKQLNKFQKLQQEILQNANKKLKEDPDQLAKMPASYQNKVQEYALDVYCYYECSKCKKPYFGGKKDCQMEGEDQQVDKNKLLCSRCLKVADCEKHGSDYIAYKCKFCCSLASWFCWGTTHFCESCHHRQCHKDYVNNYPKEKLPKCPGKELCPLKIEHLPNGEEFALGCAICKSDSENKKKQQIQQF